VLDELQTTLSERKRIVQETQKTREAKREEKREEMTQKENEITRAQSSIKALNDGIEKNTKRYEREVNSELVSRQEEELTALRKEIAEKQKTLEERRRKREALTKSIQTYDYKKETAQNTIRKITELSSCPTCLQTVTDEYKRDVLSVQKELIENAQRVLTELSESKQTLQSEENTLKEEIEHMQKKQLTLHTTYEQNKKTLTENKRIAQEIQSDRERIVALNRSLEQYIKERDKLKQMQDETYKKERDTYDQSIRYIERAFQQVQSTIYTVKETLTLLRNIQERATSAESVSKQITDVKERIVKIEQSISELAIDSDTIKQYRDEVETIKERVNSITVQLAELQKDKSYIDEQMQTIQKEIDEKTKAKEEFDFLSSLHSWLTDYFTKLTDVIERHVFLTIYQEFNESFRKWFEILMDSEEITVQLDSQFTPLVSINGYDAEYQHLSGGEKTAIALSYRIALNEILHRTFSGIKTRDLIILDEPTDGFSYQQIDRIQDLLDQIHCTQTIVVSHETKIESYVDTIIRVQKENHVSHVIQ
jgi:exonuclease SbcC